MLGIGKEAGTRADAMTWGRRKDMRQKQKQEQREAGVDACITLIDARSAFGEVNDNLIQSVLRCHNIPDEGRA